MGTPESGFPFRLSRTPSSSMICIPKIFPLLSDFGTSYELRSLLGFYSLNCTVSVTLDSWDELNFFILPYFDFHRCQREGGESQRLVVLSVMLAFGAMLSKEHGITVLGINFTWDVYLHRRLISK